MVETSRRRLIVNADDFGRSPGVNRGIIEAFENGIVTSASMMVRWPAAVEAAAYGQEHPALDLGLHLDLGEWACEDGRWMPVYEVAAVNDVAEVEEEVARQLVAFRRLVGRDPTHLDSHQHFHREEPMRSGLVALARMLGVPLRHYCPRIAYCGNFYGQTSLGSSLPNSISVEALVGILFTLPPGVTELACHPGLGEDIETGYLEERAREVATLCDSRVRATIESEGIALSSFKNEALRWPELAH
jgi:chitin disaccharide deacetylase